MKDRALSPYFTLHEFLRSTTAERIPKLRAQQYDPPEEVLEGIEKLAQNTLTPLRERIETPIHISSGYRCPDLNKLVGGARTSQHLRGEAADIEVGESRGLRIEAEYFVEALAGLETKRDLTPNGCLFCALVSLMDKFRVDQLIHEYGTPGRPAWVHVSHGPRNRREILRVWIGRDGKKKTEKLTVKGALRLCGKIG